MRNFTQSIFMLIIIIQHPAEFYEIEVNNYLHFHIFLQHYGSGETVFNLNNLAHQRILFLRLFEKI